MLTVSQVEQMINHNDFKEQPFYIQVMSIKNKSDDIVTNLIIEKISHAIRISDDEIIMKNSEYGELLSILTISRVQYNKTLDEEMLKKISKIIAFIRIHNKIKMIKHQNFLQLFIEDQEEEIENNTRNDNIDDIKRLLEIKIEIVAFFRSEKLEIIDINQFEKDFYEIIKNKVKRWLFNEIGTLKNDKKDQLKEEFQSFNTWLTQSRNYLF